MSPNHDWSPPPFRFDNSADRGAGHHEWSGSAEYSCQRIVFGAPIRTLEVDPSDLQHLDGGVNDVSGL